MRKTKKYAVVGKCQKFGFNPVGQLVGQMNEWKAVNRNESVDDEVC